MIGASWNCRGLGNPRAVLALRDIIKSRKLNFIFLCETLVHANKINEMKYFFSYYRSFCMDRESRRGWACFSLEANEFLFYF